MSSFIKDQDVRIDTFTNSSPWVDMRLTHIPTGKTVGPKRGRSQVKLKDELMEELEKRMEK